MKKAVLVTSLVLLLAADCLGGRYCEVVRFSAYESPGISTVDGMLVQVSRRCAVVTIRNTDDRSRYATDFDLTAFFENGNHASSPVDRKEDRLKSIPSGGEYTTSACFGPNDTPIVKMDCGY